MRQQRRGFLAGRSVPSLLGQGVGRGRGRGRHLLPIQPADLLPAESSSGLENSSPSSASTSLSSGAVGQHANVSPVSHPIQAVGSSTGSQAGLAGGSEPITAVSSSTGSQAGLAGHGALPAGDQHVTGSVIGSVAGESPAGSGRVPAVESGLAGHGALPADAQHATSSVIGSVAGESPAGSVGVPAVESGVASPVESQVGETGFEQHLEQFAARVRTPLGYRPPGVGGGPADLYERDWSVEYSRSSWGRHINWLRHRLLGDLSLFVDKKRAGGLVGGVRLTLEEILALNSLSPIPGSSSGMGSHSRFSFRKGSNGFTMEIGETHETSYTRIQFDRVVLDNFCFLPQHDLENNLVGSLGLYQQAGVIQSIFNLLKIHKYLPMFKEGGYLSGTWELNKQFAPFVFGRNNFSFVLGYPKNYETFTIAPGSVVQEPVVQKENLSPTAMDFQRIWHYLAALNSKVNAIQGDLTQNFEKSAQGQKLLKSELADLFQVQHEQTQNLTNILDFFTQNKGSLANLQEAFNFLNQTQKSNLEVFTALTDSVSSIKSNLSENLRTVEQNLSNQVDILGDQLKQQIKESCSSSTTAQEMKSEVSQASEPSSDLDVDFSKFIFCPLVKEFLPFFGLGVFTGIVYVSLTIVVYRSKNQTCVLVARILRKSIGWAFPFAFGLIICNMASNLVFQKPVFEKWSIFTLGSEKLQQVKTADSVNQFSNMILVYGSTIESVCFFGALVLNWLFFSLVRGKAFPLPYLVVSYAGHFLLTTIFTKFLLLETLKVPELSIPKANSLGPKNNCFSDLRLFFQDEDNICLDIIINRLG